MECKPARLLWGRRVAQWAALAAIVIGGATAGWNGYWYTVGRMAVKRDTPVPSPSPTTSFPAERSGQQDAPLGVYLGELAIPKLGVAIPVYEGVREQELRRGVGHYPASDWPGQKGHVVLSGHRDTVFRRFGELEIGDALIIRTDRAAIHYRIVNIRIVDDDDRTVLVEKARPTLTVTTCYPFRLIGRAPKRCIVTARPVRVDALEFSGG
ncbi:class D sortase [Geobacillus sp. BMUD]|uniref:class D sortase n=1 Tax=Geobacillus sp. BMUD TaxID=2508876 RepID=UPI001492A14E|nr:class D sortase [Geobacillus sp. BMUD]